MNPITLGGYTGAETDEQLYRRIDAEVWNRYRKMPETDENKQSAAAATEKHLAQHAVAKHHNRLIPAALSVQEAANAARARIAAADNAWGELRTAAAWHAAHHRWVEAVDAAADALTVWRTAAIELKEAAEANTSHFVTRQYATYVPDADQRVTAPDIDAIDETLIAFERTTGKRRAITAHTLRAPTVAA